jgi:MFS family permease
MSASLSGEKGFYGWINVAVTSVMGVAGGLYIVSFGYFLPFLVQEFGWNRGTASYAASINMIVMGICGPLAGIFIVKYGAKRALVFGNLLGCVGFFLLSLHNRMWELYLAYGILVGLGAGFGGLLASTTVLNNWFIRRRSLVLGICLGSGGLGGIFMGPALMELINTRGWRTTYVAMSAFVLLISVILPACLIRNKPQDMGQSPDGPTGAQPKSASSKSGRPEAGYRTPVDFTGKEAMHTLCLWLLIAYFCLNMTAMGALMTHMIAHLLDIGINSRIAALALGLLSGIMTFAQFSVGFFAIRFSLRSIAVTGELFKIAGVLILISTRSVPGVCLSMIVLGIGFGAVMVATFNIFPNYFGLSDYPKIMGNARFFWAFIGAAGAPLAGFIREATGNYLPAYYLVIGILVAGLISLIFAKPPVHPSLKKQPQAVETYAS